MTTDLGFWVLQMLNALQLSMLLFLLSVGLTVIFGLMHFLATGVASSLPRWPWRHWGRCFTSR